MPLTNHTHWKKKEYAISSLICDLKNPRLSGDIKSEAEAIEKLVAIENVEDLARLITQVGYVPVEDLVVVEENGKKVVIEGNRRLASYKLLHKPERAPKDKVKIFRSLKTDLGENLPKKVYVVMAPDRTQANIYVYLKHTPAVFSKKWVKVQQAVFIQRLSSGGESLEEIKRICRATESEIALALATLEIYELAPVLNLPSGIKEALTDPKHFPYSAVIERIIGVPAAQKQIGFSLSPVSAIEITGGKERFQFFLTRILKDALTPDPKSPKKKILDTRALGDVGLLKSYLDDIEEELPKAESKGKPETVRTLYASLAKGQDTKADPPSSTENSPKVATKPIAKGGKLYGNQLFTKRLVCKYADHRIPSVVAELQRIEIKSYPNATALLLRLLVELALIGGLKNSGNWEALNRYIAAPENKKQYPTVSSMLNFICKEETGCTLKVERRVANILKKLVSKKESLFSIDTLNAYVHNEFYPATPEDLRKIAAQLEPLIVQLLDQQQ